MTASPATGGLRPPLATDACTVRGQICWPARQELPKPQPVADAQYPGVPAGTVYEDLRVDAISRGVRDVVVWLADDPINRTGKPLRDGLPAYTPAAHTLTAGPARFDRRVLVSRVGDTLRVAPGPHRVSIDGEERTAAGPLALGRAPLAVTAAPGGWMKAWVWAFDHPYSAVTGADGRFAIPGVPPGPRRLVVWHELGYHRHHTGGEPITVPAAESVDVPAVEIEFP